MTTDWEQELEKCKNSYYFFTTYCNTNGIPATTNLSESQFNNYLEIYE